MNTLTWTVFAKPWRSDDASRLASRVAAMGFDGIELPVRPGFPVSPENAATELPRWSAVFADAGLTIASVAGDPTAGLFHACAEAGVPIIRIMAPLSAAVGRDLAATRAGLEEYAVRSHDTGVRVAVQQHHGRFVSSSAGLRSLLTGLPGDAVGAAWDAGHSALAGEAADIGLGEIRDRLMLVNLKNAWYPPPRDRGTDWTPRWVTGRAGMGRWGDVARALGDLDYTGTICLSAQYTDADDVDRLAREDLRYARSVFGADPHGEA